MILGTEYSLEYIPIPFNIISYIVTFFIILNCITIHYNSLHYFLIQSNKCNTIFYKLLQGIVLHLCITWSYKKLQNIH
jgi:hypothetical protein